MQDPGSECLNHVSYINSNFLRTLCIVYFRAMKVCCHSTFWIHRNFFKLWFASNRIGLMKKESVTYCKCTVGLFKAVFVAFVS